MATLTMKKKGWCVAALRTLASSMPIQLYSLSATDLATFKSLGQGYHIHRCELSTNPTMILIFWHMTAVKVYLLSKLHFFCTTLCFSSLKHWYILSCLVYYVYLSLPLLNKHLNNVIFACWWQCYVVLSMGFIAFCVVCLHRKQYLLPQMALECVLNFVYLLHSFLTVIIFWSSKLQPRHSVYMANNAR